MAEWMVMEANDGGIDGGMMMMMDGDEGEMMA